MATYKSKKYNGNIVETLEKFQKKFPGKKIVKVTESEEGLSITTEAEDKEPDGEYKKCQKTQYTIEVYVPKAGTKVHNKLENSDYVTNEKKPFVLVGTAGEEWTVDAGKLAKTYTLDGKPIDDAAIQQISDGKKHKITTKKDAGVNWCKFVPANTKCKVETSWGETLEANRSGVPHGKGDYIVTADDNGKPNPNDRWVVNGEIFDKTYKIIGGSVSEAGNQKWMGDTKCDFCHKECGNTLYDGKTDMGPWAVMCDMCFHDHGVGLGTGMGQQYKKVGSDYVKVPDKKKPAGRKSVDDDTARMFRGMLGW